MWVFAMAGLSAALAGPGQHPCPPPPQTALISVGCDHEKEIVVRKCVSSQRAGVRGEAGRWGHPETRGFGFILAEKPPTRSRNS